jgi:CheY-like chemotaxis protein
VTGPKHLLIVEDDLQLAEMLGDYFGAQAYRVTAVHRGEDALAALEQGQPDLILMDVNLPGIDGFETCRRLRRLPHVGHTPVFFLTQRREREDILAGLELGAVDYVTKPFDIHELSLRVSYVLHRAATGEPVNTITGLPEGLAVQERLSQMLLESDWALVIARLVGLGRFRERYGFIAAEDVMRAAGRIVVNAKDAARADDAFVGHVDQVSFAIVTAPGREDGLARHCLSRLQAAIPYFYPAGESGPVPAGMRLDGLVAEVRTLCAGETTISDLGELRAALLAPA